MPTPSILPQPRQVWCTVTGMEHRILIVANREGSPAFPVTVVFEDWKGHPYAMTQEHWLSTHSLVALEVDDRPLRSAGSRPMTDELRNKLTAMRPSGRNRGRQVKIEGRLYDSVKSAYAIAVKQGYHGHVASFSALLQKLPANPTWAQLVAGSTSRSREEQNERQRQGSLAKKRYAPGPNSKEGQRRAKREADAAELQAAIEASRARRGV